MKSSFRHLTSRGATLHELLIASTLLFLCFTMVFLLFHRGRSALERVEKSGGMQATLLKLKVKFQVDFQMTSLSSVTVEPTAGLPNRDMVTCVTIDDWSNPDNFSTRYPGPLWNQRVTYVHALENEGDLDRVVYIPDEPESLKAKPLLRVWPLEARDEIVNQTRLSKEISQFIVETDADEKLMKVRVSLKADDKQKTATGEFVYVPRHSYDYI